LVAIYTLTSELHDEKAVGAVTKEFLGSLDIEYVFRGNDYSDYGSYGLSLIYVCTGGTEGIFKKLLPDLQAKSISPFYLLTSGRSNSLAASMEILSYLRQNNMKGEIIHGSYITKRIKLLSQVEDARNTLLGSRLGIIGQPSDWLISSSVDERVVRQRFGVELVNIRMKELLEVISETPEPLSEDYTDIDSIRSSLPGANKIYKALKTLVENYQLQGFTLRCFDLLTAIKNTGCLALAKLNAEGIVAGCEGDVPAMISMMIVRSLLGVSGFQANPSRIDPETGELIFAHCTIPLNMVERFEYDTHFESGIGVGIRGFMKEGPVTVFKVSGDKSRHFIAEGYLTQNLSEPNLCRTQQKIQLTDKSQISYFLSNPIGNHHIILPGHYKALLEEMVSS
jgi:L-fucose isomerase-like protein